MDEQSHEVESAQTEPNEPRPGRTRTAAALVGAVLVGALIGGLVIWVVRSNDSDSTAGASMCAVRSVAAKVLPSIVTISASQGLSSGTGSGEVIRSDGYILTNNHVVSLAADGGNVSVLFDDGHRSAATIVGRDPLADLAVIKVVDNTAPVITFSSSAALKIGQPVVALGAPLGLSGTVTSGIVSALDRTINVPGDDRQIAVLGSAIQTDASINPGNSGGALVDCAGTLVGVPTAGATAGGAGSIGLGFAIPSDTAKLVADEIIATGSANHSYLGMQTTAIPPRAAQAAGLPTGLLVGSVTPNGPAALAGVQTGDVITAIDGRPATTSSDLTAITLSKRAGQTVELTYSRDGASKTTTVTLSAAP